MEIPSYLSPGPAYHRSAEMRQAFDEINSASEPGEFIDYQLPYPKWQFLFYLCENKKLILHGSQEQDIQEGKPDKRMMHAISVNSKQFMQRQMAFGVFSSPILTET